MARQVQAIFSLLLVAACAATVAAHAPPPTPASPPPPPSPTIPGLLSPPGIPSLLPPGFPSLLPPGFPGLFPPGIPGNPADIAKCWSSLQDVPGCAIEISTSIFTGRFGLGPACCKAFQTIDDNCLNKMFPLLPLLPPLLKSQCGKVNGAAP